ncbi:hypothetical protein SpCBS45565_g03144 [Spizellomyces sp. 'palustris']|nr:hypothetical protein SpCBS45565_g03144 [Spizellomyces sp. 'palustris']
MHASVVESIVADAHVEVLIPATDSTDAEDILKAPPRDTVFYDETLHCYVLFRPSQAPSAAKVTAAMLTDIASRGLDLHVVVSIGEIDEADSTVSAFLPAAPKAAPPAPPPAAHHLSAFPHRNRSATTGSPVPLKGSHASNSSNSAGYLASPARKRRTTSLKSGQVLLGPLDSQPLKKSPLSSAVTPTTEAKDEEILYSFVYDAVNGEQEPIVLPEQRCCLFPLRLPIAILKARSKDIGYSIIVRISLISKSTQQSPPTMREAVLCDPEDFDAPNLLAGLANDAYFNPEGIPVHRLPNHPKRPSLTPATPSPRVMQKCIPVQPILDITINIVDAGLDSMLMSLALENNVGEDSEFCIESLNVNMTNAIISRVDETSVRSEPDELHLLYNVALLEDACKETPVESPTSPPGSAMTSRMASFASLGTVKSIGAVITPRIKRLLSISIKGTSSLAGSRGQVIGAKWFTQLLFGGDSESKTLLDVVPLYGRKNAMPKEIRILNEKEGDGLQLSFSIASQVYLRHIFTVQAFFVNRSTKTRNLNLIIPTKATPSDTSAPSLPRSLDSGINLHMEEEEFLRRYLEMEKREASLVCLEHSIQLSALHPNTCQTVNLHFVAIKGLVHTIEDIQLIDRDSGGVMHLRNVLEIHVLNANT